MAAPIVPIAAAGALLWWLFSKKDEAAPAPAPEPYKPAPLPAPTPAAEPAPQTVHVDDMPKNTWRPSDPNVSWVQARLQDLGYDPGPIDGIMGPRTRGAIAEYQKDSDLPATGELDASTLMLLQGNKPGYRPEYQNPKDERGATNSYDILG